MEFQTEDIVAAIPIAILKLSVTRYLLRLGEIGDTVGYAKTDLGFRHKSVFIRIGVPLTVQRTKKSFRNTPLSDTVGLHLQTSGTDELEVTLRA